MMISRIRCFHSILVLLLICGLMMALVPLTLADSAGQVLNNSSPPLGDVAIGRAELVFDFPADHLLHPYQSIVKEPEHFLEWLYWTGALTDTETGELVGFQYTLFQQNLKPGLIGYVNHAAISDVANSQHPLYRYATLPDQAEVTNGTDGIRGDFWRYQDAHTTLTYWKDQDAWNIIASGNVSDDRGHGQNISLNLILLNDDLGYYLHHPGGVNTAGFCEEVDPENMTGMTYYYSHPSMNTTGTVTIDGREIEVKGESWFDHQWGGFGRCYPAWDWFSLRLDDGRYLMLYAIKDPMNQELIDLRGLTYIDQEGNATWWTGGNAFNMTPTRWWTSDLFGFSYPLDWTFSTPAGDFAIEPYFDEQTMNVGEGESKYWEGIMRIREGHLSGEQIGVGYMELAGYAPISIEMNTSA
jgi:predicted secreted hydrolase